MVEFDRTLISNLPKSLAFFIRSLVLSCNTLLKGVRLSDKPKYVEQSEEFSEFFENILREKGAVEKFREKILKDIYEDNYTDIISKAIDDDNNPHDSFMLDDLNFNFGKFCLPISTIYKNITEYAKKNRSVHPPKIMLGFYATMFHTVKNDGETKETLDLISNNINIMIEAIEDISRPLPSSSSGNFLMDALKKFNPGEATEMFNKIGSDPRMSEEFKKVHGKVTDIFKSENPMDALNSLFKEMSAEAASHPGGIPGLPGFPLQEASPSPGPSTAAAAPDEEPTRTVSSHEDGADEQN